MSNSGTCKSFKLRPIVSYSVTSIATSPSSSDSDLPPVDDMVSIIKLKQWLRRAPNTRDLSQHSAPAAIDIDSPYYGRCYVLGVTKADLEGAPHTALEGEGRNLRSGPNLRAFRVQTQLCTFVPKTVLSELDLFRIHPQRDHLCERCAKNLALSIDCLHEHSTRDHRTNGHSGQCAFLSGMLLFL
jgi:hypothetical protein